MPDFDIERMLRLNGKRPTARDEWRAFWRLWRVCRKRELSGPASEPTLTNCLFVLGMDRSFTSCAHAAGDDPSRSMGLPPASQIPAFLRRKFLETAKRRRLYGKRLENWDEWRPRDLAVVRKLADQGIESTPEEVAETRWKLFRKCREVGAVELPDSDVELLRLIALAMKGGGE